jgi:hypothetical protein
MRLKKWSEKRIKNKRHDTMNIPEIFHHSESGKQHDRCVMCEDDLLTYEFGYVIEKAFQKNKTTGYFETIFEYALCKECQKKIAGEMSQESMLNIQRYFIENALQNDTFSKLFKDVESRLKNCMVKGDSILDGEEYQIAGQFKKDQMILNDTFPFAIGETAILEIQDLLSTKTKGFMNKFKDLILPPEVRDKIPDNRFIFL